MYIRKFKRTSLAGLIVWILSVVIAPLVYLFINSEKTEIMVLGINTILLVLLVYFLIVSLIQHTKIHDLAGQKGTAPWAVWMLLGTPAYFLFYLVSRKELKEISKQIR